MPKKTTQPSGAWIVSLDMGYGHGRAAYPLRHSAPDGNVINANTYEGIPPKDFAYWKTTRSGYELISRLKKIPLLGTLVFGIMDRFQKIAPYNPNVTHTKPTLQLRQTYAHIRKGLGKHLIRKLNKNPIPLVATFFTAAYMAEEHGYKGPIYLVLCDSDVSRAWAPLHPETSRIIFCAPNDQVAKRLQTYGVRSDKIVVTGFPMPMEIIGSHQEITAHDLANRLKRLSPQKTKYPITITFAVGGAGAQTEIGARILASLASAVHEKKIKIVLIAGVRKEVYEFLHEQVRSLGLARYLGAEVTVHFSENKQDYFSLFNHLMRTTDILITKPSELVFYTALGIPMIMTPPIGSQEDFNQAWLEQIGAGIALPNPDHTRDWLFDCLKSGLLARTAENGRKHGLLNGVGNIEKLIAKKYPQKK